MSFLKKKLFFPLVLGCAIMSGCGGGGSSSGGIVATSCTPTLLTTSSKLKISVKQNGIYVITPNTLKQFCLDPSAISLSSFKLKNFDPTPGIKRLVDIPISFDTEGNIEFYGVGVNRNDYTAPNADYTETNVYWLIPATTSSPQLTMAFKTTAASGTTIPGMTTLHVENNNVYWPDMPNAMGISGLDHWFWKQFTGAFATSTSFSSSFMINNYDNPSSVSPLLRVSLATNNQSASFLMLFNGSPLLSQTSWSNTDSYFYTTSIPSNLITNSVLNFFQIATAGPDWGYLNWFEIEYPGKALNDQIVFHGNISPTASYTFSVNGFTQSSVELFDISDPKAPLAIANPAVVSLAGGGFQLTFSDTLTASIPNNYIALTSTQRQKPANITLANAVDSTQIPTGTNYLIISHENFLTNIQPLVNYRTTNGGSYSVHVSKIGDVYDSYSGGIFTPQAIKDFLRSANAGSVQYVLLVGDASIDFNNYLGNGQENFVPTALIDYSFGQTVSDYWFVENPLCNISIPSTCNPVKSIGRLSAKTGTEVDTVVNKIIGYETTNNPFTPSWNKNVLFVSGSDTGATFDTDSDTLAALVSGTSPGYQVAKVYWTAFNSTSTMNSTILYYINNGAVVTNYMGHGSVGFWANCISGACINLFFNSSNVPNLNNSTKLTFLVTLDCLNGMFAGYGEGVANPYSIAETFLKSSTGGSIASFGPTGQGYTTYHMTLATQLYQTLFGTISFPRVPVIGNAIKQAETNVLLAGNSPQDLETARIFVLLGDPATRLALP